MTETERPEAQEGFGEASLGEAQSENPPNDPEMIRDEAAEGEDPDRGPGHTADESDPGGERDQAEG